MADEWVDINSNDEWVDVPNQGAITQTPPLNERLLARGKRFGALATKGILGDVPFVRNLLPQNIQDVEPTSVPEKLTKDLSTLGRDLFLLKGVGKMSMAKTALRGAGVGMATAGTEEPEEIAKSATKAAVLLPILNKTTDLASNKVIKPLFEKGLKTTRQLWQDLVRAGFMVEKSSVERAQTKGIHYLLDKKRGLRSPEAFLDLAEKIHNRALELRRAQGKVVGRWRDMLFKNPRIEVSVKNARTKFQTELKNPTMRIIDEAGNARLPSDLGADTIENKLLRVNEFLKSADEFRPDEVYRLLDDLNGLSRRLQGSNEGRIISTLARDLKQQVYKSAPKRIAEGLKKAEMKFGEIADATDDVFNKLQFEKEGVAIKERLGASESALKRGLKKNTPVQERRIWERLNQLLPENKKFMELYKDVFAANDFSQEGIGWLLRRLFLSPRMAAFGMGKVQPVMKKGGQLLSAVGKTAETVTPPLLLRESLKK